MVLQELDLEILYRPGKGNSNADPLSRSPLPEAGGEGLPYAIVSAMVAGVEDKTSENDLATLQRGDAQLNAIITYLETGVLPEEEKFARSLALSQSQYVVEEGILYHVELDSTLRIIPPESLRERLLTEAHGGRFGGHLGEVKVYSKLRHHYWWPEMRKDVSGAVVAWCVRHGALDGRSDHLGLLIELVLMSSSFQDPKTGTSMPL